MSSYKALELRRKERRKDLEKQFEEDEKKRKGLMELRKTLGQNTRGGNNYLPAEWEVIEGAGKGDRLDGLVFKSKGDEIRDGIGGHGSGHMGVDSRAELRRPAARLEENIGGIELSAEKKREMMGINSRGGSPDRDILAMGGMGDTGREGTESFRWLGFESNTNRRDKDRDLEMFGSRDRTSKSAKMRGVVDMSRDPGRDGVRTKTQHSREHIARYSNIDDRAIIKVGNGREVITRSVSNPKLSTRKPR